MEEYTWIAVSVICMSVLLLTGCDTQYRMLYYPSPSLPSDESLANRDIRFWPSGRDGYRGFVGVPERGEPKGTFIIFHGNGGTAMDRDFYVEALTRLGYRVVLAEYPLYGGRKGKLGEDAFVKDGGETVRIASEKYGGPVYLLGESLGCGVAAAISASTRVAVAGIVLITPWDNLRSVARSHFPAILVRLLLKDSYDNAANLAMFRGRIAVVGAERDDIIPLHHARSLFGSLPAQSKRMWVIGGAGHNDWPMHADQSLWRELVTFVTGGGGQGG